MSTIEFTIAIRCKMQVPETITGDTVGPQVPWPQINGVSWNPDADNSLSRGGRVVEFELCDVVVDGSECDLAHVNADGHMTCDGCANGSYDGCPLCLEVELPPEHDLLTSLGFDLVAQTDGSYEGES